jgi:hypothetical protein
MSLFADTLWPLVAITVLAALLIGLARFLRPTLRDNSRFRTIAKTVALIAIVELVLVPVYMLVLVTDMPPISDL